MTVACVTNCCMFPRGALIMGLHGLSKYRHWRLELRKCASCSHLLVAWTDPTGRRTISVPAESMSASGDLDQRYVSTLATCAEYRQMAERAGEEKQEDLIAARRKKNNAKHKRSKYSRYSEMTIHHSTCDEANSR